MNDDTKERIEILTKALQVCVGEGAQRLIDRILFLEENDTNILDGFKELQDKLREAEQQRDEFRHKNLEKLEIVLKQNDKLDSAIQYIIGELRNPDGVLEKIRAKCDYYLRKHGL